MGSLKKLEMESEIVKTVTDELLLEINGKENNIEFFKKNMQVLINQREQIKRNIIDFKDQIRRSNSDLDFKAEEIDDIQKQLTDIEMKKIWIRRVFSKK